MTFVRDGRWKNQGSTKFAAKHFRHANLGNLEFEGGLPVEVDLKGRAVYIPARKSSTPETCESAPSAFDDQTQYYYLF